MRWDEYQAVVAAFILQGESSRSTLDGSGKPPTQICPRPFLPRSPVKNGIFLGQPS